MFQISEVWDEVITELEAENVQLIDADNEAAETIRQAQMERAKAIQNLQGQLKEAKIQQDKQSEQLLFQNVRTFVGNRNFSSKITVIEYFFRRKPNKMISAWSKDIFVENNGFSTKSIFDEKFRCRS